MPCFFLNRNSTQRRKVFVAMSGGVDSSVTAALLKERGFEVTGVHIKMWSDPDIPCNFKEDRYDAMRVAAKLDITFDTWDFTKEYRQAVVEYMIREYASGRTPNPDVMCNREIKFGVFLKKALECGADFVATGHYARVVPSTFPLSDTYRSSSDSLTNDRRVASPAAETMPTRLSIVGTKETSRAYSFSDNKIVSFKLLNGVDGNKDQSYFLWTLTQKQLRHCLFPMGEYTKPEVRELARKFGLPTAEKPDSQGICFMGEIDVRDFLKKYIPVERGRVLTTLGKMIGEHDGLPFYTIGERHGLGIGGGIPYYVAGKDYNTNTLLVAEGPYDEKLFSSELVARHLNWIYGKEPRFPLQCEARIRYRQPLQSCVIRENSLNNSRSIRAWFKEPQRAVTPGQSIVFYKEGEILGGGIIRPLA